MKKTSLSQIIAIILIMALVILAMCTIVDISANATEETYIIFLNDSGSKLNVRIAPDTNSEVIGKLPHGTTVWLKGISETGEWALIDANDITGWVASKYIIKIKNSEECKIYTLLLPEENTAIKVHTEPTSESEVIGNIDNYSQVQVFEMNGEWAKIKFNDTMAWIINKYLTTEQNIPMFGIDVSKWQGKINWSKVDTSNIDFVIIRIGYSGKIDPNFEENYAGAKSRNLPVGIYYYTYATTVEQANRDAKECLTWLKGRKLEFPIYFDLEDKKQSDLGKEANTQLSLSFLNEIKKAGYLSGLYTATSWVEGGAVKVDKNIIEQQGHEIWVARYYDGTYNDKFGYSERYGMWQYSSTGTVEGINGDIDCNICYKDYVTYIKQNHLSGYSNIDEHERGFINGNRPLYGDVNHDKEINLLDVTTIQQYIAGLVNFSDEEKQLADTDKNKEIQMQDIVLIQKYLSGIINYI